MGEMLTGKFTAKMTIDGKSFPVASFGMKYSMNIMPQLHIKIPMGFALNESTTAIENVDVSTIKEGSSIEMSINITGDKPVDIVYSGKVVEAKLDTMVNTISGSKGTYNIRCEHEIAQLGGLSAYSRLYMGGGVAADLGLDSYRELLQDNSEASRSPIGTLITNATSKAAVNYIIKQGNPVPGLILETLKELFETEIQTRDKEKDNNGSRELDTLSIALLEKLINNVKGGVLKAPDRTLKVGVPLFISYLVRNIGQAWPGSNALDILIRSLSTIFYTMCPDFDGEIYIKNYCPALKAYDRELDPKHIIGVTDVSGFSLRPVIGIRMKVNNTFNDAFAEQVQGVGGTLIQYPDGPDALPGLYEYISPGPYKVWFSFISKNSERKETNPASLKTVNNNKGEKKLEKKDPTAETGDLAELKAYNLELAKAIYGMKKWKNSTIVLNVHYNTDVAVGERVRLDLTKSTELADQIPTGIYHGVVQEIGMNGANGRAGMSVVIGSVRSDEDNEEFALDERPIFEEPPTEEEEAAAKTDAEARAKAFLETALTGVFGF